MMEVKFWKDVIHKRHEILGALHAGQLNAIWLETNIDGLPPVFTPKPLHGFFMALFSLATGLNAEWVGCLWSALIGTLTIALVGWWVSRHFTPQTAIVAAFLMALCHSHVMYSRSQLAEADAIFFMTCAIFFHANAALRFRRDQAAGAPSDFRPIPLIAVGVLYGIAVGVNYRCLILLPLVFLWDIWTSRRCVKRLAMLVIGLGVVLCLIELPYRIYIWRGGTLPDGVFTYFQGFWERLFRDVPTGQTGVGTSFRPHLNILEAYVELDKLWWLVGIMLGAGATWVSRCPVRRLVCLLALAPIVFFSLFSRGDGPRAVMTSIPFFAAMAAFAVMDIHAACKKKIDQSPKSLSAAAQEFGLALVIVSFGSCVGFSGADAWRETQVRSAWQEAGRWMADQPRQVVTTTNPLAVRYYLRKDLAQLPSMEDTAAVTPGLWVIDRYNATYAYPYPVVQKLISSYKPERVFTGQVYPQTGLFFDWGVFMRSGNWREELEREHMGDIEVYRIQ